MGAVCSGAHPVRHAARVRRFKQDDIASKNRCRPDPAIAISYLFNSKHRPMIAIGVVYGVAPRALGVGERVVHQCLEIQGSTRQAGGPHAHRDRQARALIVDEHAQGRQFAVSGVRTRRLSRHRSVRLGQHDHELLAPEPGHDVAPAPRRVGTPHHRVA